MIALFSLLTHAGVDSNKVLMGVGNYGRSFGMKDPNCWQPNGVCEFTGPKSAAEAGECTNTPGYIARSKVKIPHELQ